MVWVQGRWRFGWFNLRCVVGPKITACNTCNGAKLFGFYGRFEGIFPFHCSASLDALEILVGLGFLLFSFDALLDFLPATFKEFLLEGERDGVKRYLLLTCQRRPFITGHWITLALFLHLLLESIISSFVLFCVADFNYFFQDDLDFLLLDFSLFMDFLQFGKLFLTLFALSLGNSSFLGQLLLNLLSLYHFSD